MKQCDLTKGFVVFLTIMITFFCGVMPSSWAEDDVDVVPKCNYCEDQKFKDCYGFSHDGMMEMRVFDADGNPVFDADGNPVFTGVPIPMASVGVFYLDGRGNLTGHEMVNFGGTSFPAKIRGRYKVNLDCTGRALICATPRNGDPGIKSEISFVITGGNFDEMQMVTTKMTSCDYSDVVVARSLNIVGMAKKQSCDDEQ